MTPIATGHRAEGALCASEDVFRRRFTEAPVPQAMIHPDGRFEQVNAAMAAVAGMSAEEMVGRVVLELVHPDERTECYLWFLSVLAGDEVSPGATWRYQTANGEIRWGLTHLLVLRDETGAPRQVASFVQDVTAEKEAAAEREAALSALGDSERRFRALVHRSADAALIIDAEGLISYASPALEALLGYSPQEVVGRNGFDFVHPDEQPKAGQRLAKIVATPGAHPPFTLRLRHADGRYVLTEEAVTNCLADPAIGGLVLNLRDVQARVTAEAARADAERRYRTIVETAEEGIWVLDAAGRTNFVNPRLCDMLGRSAKELIGTYPTEFVPAADRERIAADVAGLAAVGSGHYEVPLLRGDGTPIWVLVSARALRDDDTGESRGSHAMLTDITERKAMEERLRHHALHDELTGLPNRALLRDRMGQLLARGRRRGTLGAALFVDVDNFKLVNDSLGHAAGDQLLIAIAGRIRDAIRQQDTVARHGGDEFVVLADELADHGEALAIARRVQEALGEPFQLRRAQLTVTASIGVALTPAADTEELLRDADAAMYRAKELGRSRVEVFDRTVAYHPPGELQLASDLRLALRGDGGGLQLDYQPVVALRGGRVVGAEALVRWRHTCRGLIFPDTFVPLAERHGLARELDRWVLTEACAQAARWVADGTVNADFQMAVNISAKHLADPSLPATVQAALTGSGLAASQLAIEITETAMVVDGTQVTDNLAAVRRLGVKVSLDDFGTGYSSIAFLDRLPADALKIDRSFVAGIGNGGRGDAIAANLVRLAGELGLECVAEGVETAEQLRALRRWGCPRGQGFLWSRPVSAAQFLGLYRDSRARGSRLRRAFQAASVSPLREASART